MKHMLSLCFLLSSALLAGNTVNSITPNSQMNFYWALDPSSFEIATHYDSVYDYSDPVVLDQLNEIIVVATYLGDDSYSTVNPQTDQHYNKAVTWGKIQIKEVIKGNVNVSDTLPVWFEGGRVTVAEYLKGVEPDSLLKMTDYTKMSQAEQENTFITFSNEDELKPKAGVTYICFLTKDPLGNFILVTHKGAIPAVQKVSGGYQVIDEPEMAEFLSEKSSIVK